jgi:hypothetical protein
VSEPGPAIEGLEDTARDRLHTACAQAFTAAGSTREVLFLARLALLLFEAVGDEARCRAAIAAAPAALPHPSLSAVSPPAVTAAPLVPARPIIAVDDFSGIS